MVCLAIVAQVIQALIFSLLSQLMMLSRDRGRKLKRLPIFDEEQMLMKMKERELENTRRFRRL